MNLLKAHWRLWIAYDGTDFVGWQKQPTGMSVESELLRAVHDLTGQDVTITVAGRTDAGVHARAQACSFDLESRFDERTFLTGLESKLPKSISVSRADVLDAEFDARRHAVGKRYIYRVHNDVAHDPFTYKYAWHLKRPLNLEKMRQAAQHLEGDLDFESFRSSSCTAAHARRYLWKVAVECVRDNIHFDIRGNAFCHNMVRIIVGTLVDVGSGKYRPEDVKEMLEAKDRTHSGKTAPAYGLTLDQIYYPDNLGDAGIPEDAEFPRYPVTKTSWPF